MTDSLTPFNKDSLSLNSIAGDNSSPANPIGFNGSPLATSKMAKLAYQMAFAPTLTVTIPIAKAIGLNESIILDLIKEECCVNEKEQDTSFFHQGEWWSRFSCQKTIERYPFLGSTKTIQRILKKLREEGYLISGNFNESKLDKTIWYRVNVEMIASTFLTTKNN